MDEKQEHEFKVPEEGVFYKTVSIGGVVVDEQTCRVEMAEYLSSMQQGWCEMIRKLWNRIVEMVRGWFAPRIW